MLEEPGPLDIFLQITPPYRVTLVQANQVMAWVCFPASLPKWLAWVPGCLAAVELVDNQAVPKHLTQFVEMAYWCQLTALVS